MSRIFFPLEFIAVNVGHRLHTLFPITTIDMRFHSYAKRGENIDGTNWQEDKCSGSDKGQRNVRDFPHPCYFEFVLGIRKTDQLLRCTDPHL
jgi:hypothetical protein